MLIDHPTRPTYETSQDRIAEARVVARLKALRGWVEVKPTPRFYPCDYCVQLDADSFGLLEVKVRQKFYSTYMMSLHKAAQIMSYAQIGGFIPMLAVHWLDRNEIGLWNPLRVGLMEPGFGGRIDRGDAQDVEPVVMIATKYVEFIPAGP